MKYFLTDNGMVEFDLTPAELMAQLVDNIPSNQVATARKATPIKQYTIVKNKKGKVIDKIPIEPSLIDIRALTLKGIKQCMESECILFKHPDTDRAAMCHYAQAGNNVGMGLSILTDSTDTLKERGVIFVVCSFTSSDENSVQINGMMASRLLQLIRQNVIDNILNDFTHSSSLTHPQT